MTWHRRLLLSSGISTPTAKDPLFMVLLYLPTHKLFFKTLHSLVFQFDIYNQYRLFYTIYTYILCIYVYKHTYTTYICIYTHTYIKRLRQISPIIFAYISYIYTHIYDSICSNLDSYDLHENQELLNRAANIFPIF